MSTEERFIPHPWQCKPNGGGLDPLFGYAPPVKHKKKEKIPQNLRMGKSIINPSLARYLSRYGALPSTTFQGVQQRNSKPTLPNGKRFVNVALAFLWERYGKEDKSFARKHAIAGLQTAHPKVFSHQDMAVRAIATVHQRHLIKTIGYEKEILKGKNVIYGFTPEGKERAESFLREN